MKTEYTSWCDEEANTKEDAITSEKRTIGDLTAQIEDNTATIESLTSEIEDLATKISSHDAELKKATKIRDGERTDFEAAEKELVETIDTLDRAYTVLKRGQTSFLQSPSKELQALSAGLSEIVKASWVNSHQKAMLQSLLQSESSSEDEDLSLQPQATTAAYTSQGGGILDAISDMKEKAEASLSDLRKNEMTSSHEFQMLEQGLKDELDVMTKRKGEAASQRSSTEEAMHTAEGELSETKEALASDETYLSDLKQSCATKASEWSQRQKDASEEMGAIAKAKEILESGVKAFVQIGSTVRRYSDDSAKRDQVTQVLKGLSKKEHSFALAQLMSAIRSDPFGKVRGLIEGMIDKLTKEAAEEASTKAFCDEETSESNAKKADLTAKLDKTAARTEKAEAGKAKLLENIKLTTEEIASMDANEAEATAVRQKEHAEYEKASADYKASAEAVASATSVLREYYEGSFVQVSTKQPEFGGAKTDVASTIMSMLEVAESDFTKLLADAEAEESEAQSTYDKLTQDNKVARATKEAEIKGMKSEVKSLETSLLNYKEDSATTTKELDAVLAYLDELKPQCETKVMSYAERKARREDEIAGLKEALEILAA